jgi:uncharacterized protein (DUF849 family)
VLLKACLNGGTARDHAADTVVLEDGRPASGNRQLVEAAAQLIAEV